MSDKKTIWQRVTDAIVRSARNQGEEVTLTPENHDEFWDAVFFLHEVCETYYPDGLTEILFEGPEEDDGGLLETETTWAVRLKSVPNS